MLIEDQWLSVVGSRITSSHSRQFWWLEDYTLGLPQFGCVAPKSTPVQYGRQNDTAISSVVHHVGREGKVVNTSNPGSPSPWRCCSIIRRNMAIHNVRWDLVGYHYGRNVQAQFGPIYADDSVNQYCLLVLM